MLDHDLVRFDNGDDRITSIRQLPNGRWQNATTGKFIKAPAFDPQGRAYDAKTGRPLEISTVPTKPRAKPAPAELVEFAPGRWRNAKTGKLARAPVVKNGRVVDPKNKREITIISKDEYTRRKAEKAERDKGPVHDNIRDGNTSPTAEQFKRGVINLAIQARAPNDKLRRIQAMNANNILAIYNSSPGFFDTYFAYDGDGGDDPDLDMIDDLIEEYDRRFG